MKKVLLLTGAILMCASLAFAQGGSIGLFANNTGTDCNILDTVAGLCSVYIVHVNAPGVTASEWAVSQPSCVLAVYLSDSSPFGVYIGTNVFTGKSVGYGVCLGTPIHVATISYFCQALTPPCCIQSIIPHPINGGPSAVDCAATAVPATGGSGIWNANGTCLCTVGTEDSTWGKVKAIYE